ncbi:MAG: cytochrome c [Elusimicrobiota bacterium]
MRSFCEHVWWSAGLLLAAGALRSLTAATDGAAEGRETFELICASCHGLDGRGKAGMAEDGAAFKKATDLTSRVGARSDEELVAILTKGLGKMPGFRGAHAVSTPAVAGIVSYARDLASGKVRPSPEGKVERKMSRGKRVYLKRCGPCHGLHGDGIFQPGRVRMVVDEPEVVDLRDEPGRAGPGSPVMMPMQWFDIKEGDLTPEEMKSLMDRLHEAEKKRIGFTLDEEMTDEDLQALNRYFGELERQKRRPEAGTEPGGPELSQPTTGPWRPKPPVHE